MTTAARPLDPVEHRLPDPVGLRHPAHPVTEATRQERQA